MKKSDDWRAKIVTCDACEKPLTLHDVARADGLCRACAAHECERDPSDMGDEDE